MLRNKLLCGSSVAVLMVLSSGVMAADIDIGLSDSPTLSATGSPQSVLFTGDGTLNVSAPTTATGSGSQSLGYMAYNSGKAITTSANGTGTVNFLAGSYTTYLGADAGASGASLKAVNIANGATVDIDNNNYYVGTTTVANGGRLTFCQGDNSDVTCGTVNGTLVNNGSMAGAFTVGNGFSITNNGAMASNIALGSGSTLVLGSGSTTTGDVSGTSAAGITVAGNATVNGNIGAPTDNSTLVPVRFGGDYSLTMGSGNSISGIVSSAMDGQGTLNLNGNTHAFFDLGQSGAGLKAVNFNGGTTVLDANIYAATTTIGSTATLDQPNAGYAADTTCGVNCNTINGNLVNNGALNLRSYNLTVNAGPNSSAGNVTTSSGSVILTTITGDGNTSGVGSTNLGRITASGSVTLANGTTVTPDLTSYSAISNGARYILASGGSTATVGNVTTTNTGLYTWQVLTGSAVGQNADDIYLIASKVSLGNLAGSSSLGGIAGRNAASVASVMDGLANSDNPFAQAVNTQLGALASSSPAAVQSALKSMAPDVTGGAVQATTSAATAVSNVISSHNDAVRLASAGGQTGVATGDTLRGLGVWAQPFGFHAVQGMRNGVDGYDVNSGGIAAGIDARAMDRLRVGFAFSYGDTWVNGRNDSKNNNTQIDSYQGTLYATWQGEPWYVDAQLGYGYNQYSSKRLSTVGSISEQAQGDFGGDQYSAKLDGGYPIPVGRFTVTPNASLSYIYLTQDGYNETNAPTLGLKVSSYDTHSLKSGVGSKVSTSFAVGNGKLTPEMSAAWLHEFHDAAPATTAQFAFGGSSFRSEGATQAADSADLGLGLTYTTGPYSISAQYDSELKDGYVGQTGLLKARMEF